MFNSTLKSDFPCEIAADAHSGINSHNFQRTSGGPQLRVEALYPFVCGQIHLYGGYGGTEFFHTFSRHFNPAILRGNNQIVAAACQFTG